MSKKYEQDPLIEEIIEDLRSRFSELIVSVFGIGSYFDQNLPPNWLKNDVDLVVIVDSLEDGPKQDCPEKRFEKKQIEDKGIWIGFNSLRELKTANNLKKSLLQISSGICSI